MDHLRWRASSLGSTATIKQPSLSQQRGGVERMEGSMKVAQLVHWNPPLSSLLGNVECGPQPGLGWHSSQRQRRAPEAARHLPHSDCVLYRKKAHSDMCRRRCADTSLSTEAPAGFVHSYALILTPSSRLPATWRSLSDCSSSVASALRS